MKAKYNSGKQDEDEGIVEFWTICCQAAKNRQVKNLPSNLMPLHSPVGLLGKPWCIKNNPDLSNVNHIMFQKHPVAVIKDPEPLNFQHLSSFTTPHPHPIPPSTAALFQQQLRCLRERRQRQRQRGRQRQRHRGRRRVRGAVLAGLHDGIVLEQLLFFALLGCKPCRGDVHRFHLQGETEKHQDGLSCLGELDWKGQKKHDFSVAHGGYQSSRSWWGRIHVGPWPCWMHQVSAGLETRD